MTSRPGAGTWTDRLVRLCRQASFASATLLLAGCQASQAPRPNAPEPFELRILHLNDHHSHLAGDAGQTLQLGGHPTQVTLGGFPQVVSAFRELSAGHASVLRLHAGDATTGDLFYTLFKGRADADLMNQICFDAMALGNHEFDNGDESLSEFLDALARPLWRCQTAMLGANVRPSVGTPLFPFAHASYLRDAIVFERSGRRIGVIGLDTESTPYVSNPHKETEFVEARAAAQASIDALARDGVDIVIVLAHRGYPEDKQLAAQLSGVDVIVGGHTHSPLGDALAQVGINVHGPYPTRATSADGSVVCIVQAWQYGWVVGQLDVRFDAQGRVLDCAGTPHLMIGDDYTRSGQALDRDALQQVMSERAATPALRRFPDDANAAAVLAGYAAQRADYGGKVIGSAPRRLCVRRTPGPYDRGRDPAPGCAEDTDTQGGEVQALVAEAFLASGRANGGADLALQNGGGVRLGIAAGDFSVANAMSVLPFKNILVRLEMTGAQLSAALQTAIDYFAQAPATNDGTYPYAAGARWRVDLTRPSGQRVSDLEVFADDRWTPIDDAATYRVITTNFLAIGKDGYDRFAELAPGARHDLAVDYADSLIDYVTKGGALETPVASRRSTQSFRDVDGREYVP